MVPCGRLSWLLLSFWAHVNIVHHIIYHTLNIGTVVLNASLSINNSILPIASSVRDLGITVTNNLSPSVHISDIVSRAHKRALAIHRCFVSCHVNILLRGYKVYVRPLVEHNSIIWAPSTPVSYTHLTLPTIYSV